MSRRKVPNQSFSRRSFLKRMGLAPVVLHPAAFYGLPYGYSSAINQSSVVPVVDFRLTPSYPTKSPLEDVLRRVAPGTDEFVSEKYAFEIDLILKQWSQALKKSAHDLSIMAEFLDQSFEASSLNSGEAIPLRSSDGIDIVRKQFGKTVVPGREQFLKAFRDYLGPVERVETAEFEINSIEEIANNPLTLRVDVRYDIVAIHSDDRREERVGNWRMEWVHDGANPWKVRKWKADKETHGVVHTPAFIDVTH